MGGTPFPGGHKTALNAIDAAITAAIALMSNPNDQYQVDAKAVLDQIRRDLEQLRSLRAQ